MKRYLLAGILLFSVSGLGAMRSTTKESIAKAFKCPICMETKDAKELAKMLCCKNDVCRSCLTEWCYKPLYEFADAAIADEWSQMLTEENCPITHCAYCRGAAIIPALEKRIELAKLALSNPNDKYLAYFAPDFAELGRLARRPKMAKRMAVKKSSRPLAREAHRTLNRHIARAQVLLGDILEDGKFGKQKDQIRTIELYRSSAALGSSVAQYFIGRAYEDGRGVPPNKELAERYYRLAAANRNVGAQNQLGTLLFGKAEADNYDVDIMAEARYWLEKAAANGYEDARFNLEYLDEVEKKLGRR